MTSKATEQELNAIIEWMMKHTGTVSITWQPVYPVKPVDQYTVTWQNDAHRLAYWVDSASNDHSV